MCNFKPISPVGPGGANGGNSINTQSSTSIPTAFSTTAQLSQLQSKVETLEARLTALEAVVRHQQVLIGVLQQRVFSNR
jgi:hypothetical protein